MKLIHLSDLHLGKRVNGFSMLEDQAYVLEQIIAIVKEEAPEGILIAGDVYDKPVPPAEAVRLFDDFLYRLSKEKIQVFLISGNHDSPERLSFGGRMMEPGGIHIAPVFDGTVTPISFQDEYGLVQIYLLPFVKPAQVRAFYQPAESYQQALERVMEQIPVDKTVRNVLVTHQFVTGALCSDSEERAVGGTDQVDGNLFADFDYVALGHLHRPQKVGRESMRYCGTPLKYSFSEVRDRKSVTVVELKEKGKVELRTVPLSPLRDLRELKGTYLELMDLPLTEASNDYLHITLTDEEDVWDALARLRTHFPNLMKLDYENTRTKIQGKLEEMELGKQEKPEELFADFFETQNNRPLREEEADFLRQCVTRIWRDRP